MSARGQSTPTAKERSRVIEEALQRFPTLPTLTLARHLLHNYGYLFEYNLETVRHSIRDFAPILAFVNPIPINAPIISKPIIAGLKSKSKELIYSSSVILSIRFPFSSNFSIMRFLVTEVVE